MPDLDVRTLPSREKHPTIFGLLDALAPGETLTIINDHDPAPLRTQLARRPGLFAWDVLEAGPDVWRIAIRQLREGAAPRETALDPFPRIIDSRPPAR